MRAMLDFGFSKTTKHVHYEK